MVEGDETADSYKITADLLLSKRGDKAKVINYLFKAADLYRDVHRDKAIDCLEQIYQNVRGSTSEFEPEQYFRFLHLLGRSYEELKDIAKAADIYSELAKEVYKSIKGLEGEISHSQLQKMKKFSAYLAKALMLYDSIEKYDYILKLARSYYKVFPILQQNEVIHRELYFCYEHIINAADITGSRYFREYYAELDRKMRIS